MAKIKQVSPSLNPLDGLPGRSAMEKNDGIEIIGPGRVIRGRDGKPMFFNDHSDTQFIIDMAGAFLKRDFRRVFFLSKKGERQQPIALAVIPDGSGQSLNNGERFVVEMLAWLRARERGERRKQFMARV